MQMHVFIILVYSEAYVPICLFGDSFFQDIPLRSRFFSIFYNEQIAHNKYRGNKGLSYMVNHLTAR